MLKDVVEIIKNVALRHKGVRTFKYQGKIYNNAQNNYGTYQVYMDDISMHELNITNGIFKSSFEIYILAQPNGESGNTVLDVQNNAYTVACDIMGFIETQPAYNGVLDIYDYSILTLSHYTDDDSAGVKLSLSLKMPSPLNWCVLSDNFNDEPYSGATDTKITISGDTVSDELTITPIRLPKRNK